VLVVLSSWPESLREFTWFIWWMQTERWMASNPQTQIKPIDLGCESAENYQLPSTITVAIVIITLPVSWYSSVVPRRVEGLVNLGTAVWVRSPCPRLYVTVTVAITQLPAAWFEPRSSHHTTVRCANHSATATCMLLVASVWYSGFSCYLPGLQTSFHETLEIVKHYLFAGTETA